MQEASMKMKNDKGWEFTVKLFSSGLNQLNRNHNNKLELQFNPDNINIVNHNNDVVYTISEIKLADIHGIPVMEGFDKITSKSVIIPLSQIEYFSCDNYDVFERNWIAHIRR